MRQSKNKLIQYGQNIIDIQNNIAQMKNSQLSHQFKNVSSKLSPN